MAHTFLLLSRSIVVIHHDLFIHLDIWIVPSFWSLRYEHLCGSRVGIVFNFSWG